MYPQFFGFQKLPFRLRPDAEFLYSSQEYLQARAAVVAAVIFEPIRVKSCAAASNTPGETNMYDIRQLPFQEDTPLAPGRLGPHSGCARR